MAALRSPVDELEMLVDKNVWPVPTYGDLLFEVLSASGTAAFTALIESAKFFVYVMIAGIYFLHLILICVFMI